MKSQKGFRLGKHSGGQTHKNISKDADGQYERGTKESSSEPGAPSLREKLAPCLSKIN